MELTSPEFADHELIPTRCTCDGENMSPELHWQGLPEGTQELALTCEDPDAPGGTFVHWAAWGLDPGAPGLELGEMPAGTRQGLNDFNRTGYGGPCPPPGHGPHRYGFTLYALGERLELPDGGTIDELREAIEGKVLAAAELEGIYAR